MLRTRRGVVSLISKYSIPANNLRNASTSSLPGIEYIPNFVKRAVKSQVVDEISKHPTTRNSYQNGYNSSKEEWQDQEKVEKSTIEEGLSPIPQDELIEWNLHDKPTWTLPEGVAPLSPQVNDPFHLASPDTSILSESISANIISTNHPVLNNAAAHFFSAEAAGKMIRPTMMFLLSRVLSPTASILPSQRRLAEISEMIHTASLFHDDVLDNSDTRRGNPTVHSVFGNKVAILAGDFLLSRASTALARLRSVVVMETMCVIIDHLVTGEIMQIRPPSNDDNSNKDIEILPETRMEYYLRKNFFKTASLMAQSCMSIAILAGHEPEVVDSCYRYGKHIGLAFQLVDDILDFEGKEEVLGKPALNDLKSGIATAPVLFTLQKDEYRDEMTQMVERKFKQEGDVERAHKLAQMSDGIKETKVLAQVHAELAMIAAMELPLCGGPDNKDFRDSLVHLANKIVNRTR